MLEGVKISISGQDGAGTDVVGRVTAVHDGPLREISFNMNIEPLLEKLGHTPLPPYIHTRLEDTERYQTVYSRPTGSAAAPTAGLHFTGDLLFALRDKGVLFETVTLHVGLDTFKPVEAPDVQDHKIHSEWAQITPQTAQRINEAKLAGGRLIAVGTNGSSHVRNGRFAVGGVDWFFSNHQPTGCSRGNDQSMPLETCVRL